MLYIYIFDLMSIVVELNSNVYQTISQDPDLSTKFFIRISQERCTLLT